MKITKEMAKTVQLQLNLRYDTKLVVDGILGNKTYAAVKASSWFRRFWTIEKQILGFLQDVANEEGYNAGKVDGIWGSKSEAAFQMLVTAMEAASGAGTKIWRGNDTGINAAPSWPRQIQHELNEFYGQVGTNQARAKVPYTMKIAWNQSQTINSFTCNKRIVPYVEAGYIEVLDHYGIEKIQKLGLDQFGGCLNVRKMRGGSRYSMHSWGIAIDMDPVNNRLRWGRGKAKMSKREYNAWFDIWEAQGAVSLGRKKNYDWMHIQWARL